MAAIQYNQAMRFNSNEEESEEKCAGLEEGYDIEYEVEFEHTEKAKAQPANPAPVPEWHRWLSS